MTEPFIGEVKINAFPFAPRGWATCDGQLLPISQNQALFALLGVFFGGDGRLNFGLPDLRGRLPVHFSGGFSMGNTGGETQHTLVNAEMPFPHTHVAQGSANAGSTPLPQGNVLANPGLNAYAPVNPPQPIAPATFNTVGGQPHENMSPYLALTFCIALVGIFPSRN